MSFVNKNLRHLRLQQGWTQKELADKLGVKYPVVGAYEEERAIPPLHTLLSIAELFSLSLDVLVQEDLSKPSAKKKLAPKKEILAITVDKHDKENIELIQQKAAAGYLSGYQDPEFVSELPKISMPVLPSNRTHRAFEIQGDSMLPIQAGSIVFGEYVESLADIKNAKPYVLVTKNDGIVFKRVFRFEEHHDSLLLVSDNKLFEPYTIRAAEVMEIWLVHSYYSKSMTAVDLQPIALVNQLAVRLLAFEKNLLKK